MVRGGAAGAASPNVEIIQRSPAQYNINFGRFNILGRREKKQTKFLTRDAKNQESGAEDGNRFASSALHISRFLTSFSVTPAAPAPAWPVNPPTGPSRPQPPEYMAVPDSVPVPVEVVQNTIFMLDYIGRLEVYADSLEAVIDDLC